MALILAICKPQPNWIPKNPKLMFQICQKESKGLFFMLRELTDETKNQK
jgi:hypothetical protein